MYAALPQHQFPGSQFQAKGQIGRRCRREPSPRGFGHEMLTSYAFGQRILTCSSHHLRR
jgi:hypothetical protein